MKQITELDDLKDINWYGFGFRDGRIFGNTETNWDELKKELEIYMPIVIHDDGIVGGINPRKSTKKVALIHSKPADYVGVKR